MSIRIRITPVLKKCGFKQEKNSSLYFRDKYFGARIYKLSDSVRAIEIWENIYDGEVFMRRRMVFKNFPLDYPEDKRYVCIDFLEDLERLFQASGLVENAETYLNVI